MPGEILSSISLVLEMLLAFTLVAITLSSDNEDESLVIAPMDRMGSQRPRSESPLLIGPSEVIVIEPQVNDSIVVEPGTYLQLTIAPPPRGAWEERDWTCSQDNGHTVYDGYYQVLCRTSGQIQRYRGRVIVNGKQVTPFVAAPPPIMLTNHPKRACFHPMPGSSWVTINWRRPANNMDDAILYVERILDESINRR